MEREEGAWNEVKSREKEERRGHMERDEGAWRGKRVHGMK
jgi:hypothetical protein